MLTFSIKKINPSQIIIECSKSNSNATWQLFRARFKLLPQHKMLIGNLNFEYEKKMRKKRVDMSEAILIS